MKLYAVLALLLHIKSIYIYSRKDGIKENLEERTNEEWMNNYLENLQRLSRDKISKAEKKNLRFFEDEDEETYKIIWK